MILVHKPQDPSFSGELSVSIGVSPLPLSLKQHCYTEMQFGHCSLGALVERGILHRAASSTSRVCRDANLQVSSKQRTTTASGSPRHEWDQRKK